MHTREEKKDSAPARRGASSRALGTAHFLASRKWMAAVFSLLFTIAFFHEYFARRVYIPFDLPSFHDPLADYAFQAIRHGRIPEWDPTDYAGMPFAANPQVALFYPGTWVLFAANWRREHLSYWTLEVFVLLHIWIAWMLCYAWLRRHLGVFASACGGAIFAFSGYLMTQLQHLGLIVGCAWIPLGLAGIDESAERNSWRPLWKAAAASALAFLGGYTPTWFVVAVCLVSYAACRRGGWKWGLGACAAIAVSLGLVAIQILPAMELSARRVPEARYGLGIRDPAFYISYFIPNFYAFGPHVPVLTNSGREYMYLGVPGIVGLALLLFLRKARGEWSAAPAFGMLAVCAAIVTNPLNLVSAIVLRSTFFGQLCRDYYFLAGLTAGAAPLAAIGIDRFLARARAAEKSRAATRIIGAIACAGLAAFSIRLLYLWAKSDFVPGWPGAWEMAVPAVLFFAGLSALRDQAGALRVVLAAALLLAAGIEYKAHGTNRRFNGTLDHAWRTDWMPGMNGDVYRELRANSVYRLALDGTGPLPADLRHFDLTTPEGFDPFLTADYRRFIQTTGTFLTNWEFAVDPENAAGIHTLGIGYFVSAEQGAQFHALKENPRFRLLQPDDSFYKVFEVIDKRPPYGFEQPAGENAVIDRTRWEPERREFQVHAATAGTFYLSEEWDLGWRAQIDGTPAKIARWNGAFQAVEVPPGDHRIEFSYRSRPLRVGAAISIATLLCLLAAVRLRRPAETAV